MTFYSSGICHISFIPSKLIHCFSTLYTVGIPLCPPTEIMCLSIKVSDFSLSFIFVPATSVSSEFTMDSWTSSFYMVVLCSLSLTFQFSSFSRHTFVSSFPAVIACILPHKHPFLFSSVSQFMNWGH